jgi:hypothetical protein
MHKKVIYDVLKEIEKLEFIDNMRNHLRDKNIHFDKLVEIYLSHNLYIPCANPDVIKKYRWGNKT